MSKKKKVSKGNPSAIKWTPFIEVEPVHKPEARELDPENYDQYIKDFADGKYKMMVNSLYTVHMRYLNDERKEEGAIWLSIRHNDRKAIHDWRHFQRIKNELTGVEREGIEIYPRESRMVDEANTYHLWILDAKDSVPFGFNERRVGDSEQAESIGAGQRDFEED